MIGTLTGVIPVVPTIFHDDERLDLDGLRRVVDYLVDSGVDGICVLANYSEQFSLTDEERRTVARTVLEHNAGQVPVVTTASHYSVKVAVDRCREARDMGSDAVMLMPPFFGATMAVPEQHVLSYFRTVAAATDLPIMIQDSPMSPTSLSAELIATIAREVPQVRYVKIEVPGTADKLRAIIERAGDDLPGRFDGEESVTLMPDLDAGAAGSMPSAMVPGELAGIVRAYRSGDRDAATASWEALLPLIHFENRQCGLRAQKILMAEGGIIRSERIRSPLALVCPQTRAGLVALARTRDPLVLRWAR